MTGKSVLVDTSVWIDFFCGNKTKTLTRFIQEDIICINEIILTELIPSLKFQHKAEVIEALNAINVIHLNIDWQVIREMQTYNLSKGINKVGIPDLIILSQVIDQNLTLFSYDKHFKLMVGYYDYDLMNS